MPIKRKAQKILLPAMLIVMSPMAIAQVQSVEPAQQVEQLQQVDTIELASKEDVTERRPASWHGKKVALRGRDVVNKIAMRSKPILKNTFLNLVAIAQSHFLKAKQKLAVPTNLRVSMISSI